MVDHRWNRSGCKIVIFMGKTAPDLRGHNRQQSMILVPGSIRPGVTVNGLLPSSDFMACPDRTCPYVFSKCPRPDRQYPFGRGQRI